MNGVELLTSWFTPTVLFCVLNVMIGTIFITSSLKTPPSEQDETPPPPLVRVPSFFERVRSFNLSRHQSPQPDPAIHGGAAEETAAREKHEPEHVDEEPTIFITSSLKTPPSKQDEKPPPPLVRVPSFFERVRSFNLSRDQSPQPDQAIHGGEAEETAAREKHEPEHVDEEPHHVTRSKSETVAKLAPAARVLQKSASEKLPTEEAAEEDRLRPATVRERAAGEDEAVDEKADDFINRFRQQLKLQRLDSILRYKEMLNRGAGAGR